MPSNGSYADLSREELLERLTAAERALLVFGWTAYNGRTDRDKALHELWCEWIDLVPEAFRSPKSHPELSDEALAPLARRRDDIIRVTLSSFSTEAAA